MAALPGHRSPLDGVFTSPVELLQILFYVIEGAGALRCYHPLKLHLFGTLGLLAEEVQDVQVGITKVSIVVDLLGPASPTRLCGRDQTPASGAGTGHGLDATC